MFPKDYKAICSLHDFRDMSKKRTTKAASEKGKYHIQGLCGHNTFIRQNTL